MQCDVWEMNNNSKAWWSYSHIWTWFFKNIVYELSSKPKLLQLHLDDNTIIIMTGFFDHNYFLLSIDLAWKWDGHTSHFKILKGHFTQILTFCHHLLFLLDFLSSLFLSSSKRYFEKSLFFCPYSGSQWALTLWGYQCSSKYLNMLSFVKNTQVWTDTRKSKWWKYQYLRWWQLCFISKPSKM